MNELIDPIVKLVHHFSANYSRYSIVIGFAGMEEFDIVDECELLELKVPSIKNSN